MRYVCNECGEDHGPELPVAGTRCGCGNEVFVPSRDTIRSLAAEIKKRWPELDVKVEQGHANTDRKIPGTRLRRPGKGRKGARIIVRDPSRRDDTWLRQPRVLLDHNNAETYRRTSEVRDWIERYAVEHKGSRRGKRP
jgi:hypothetical protein